MTELVNRLSLSRALILSVLMLFAFAYQHKMSHGRDIMPLKPFSTFPKEIGEWKGEERFFSKEIYQIVGVNDSTLISFTNPKGNNIQLYIGYYKSQREGDLIHSPKNCMPGSGWDITHTNLVDVEITNTKTIQIIELVLEKGGEKQLVLYWFHSRGRIVNSEYLQKIYMVVDSILKNRTDDSFVRIIAPVNDNNESGTLEYMKSFVIKLLPILDEYIPS